MIKSLGSFVGEMRAVGLPVSTAEALDAAEALLVVDLADREGVREALAATLIKMPRNRAPFDVAFDVFFGGAAPAGGETVSVTAAGRFVRQVTLNASPVTAPRTGPVRKRRSAARSAVSRRDRAIRTAGIGLSGWVAGGRLS